MSMPPLSRSRIIRSSCRRFVLSELLSAPDLPADVKDLLVALPLLPMTDGYWERAGLLRARILSQGRRANLADTLIAQSCLDHDVELITRDADFRHFAGPAGLKLSRWRSR